METLNQLPSNTLPRTPRYYSTSTKSNHQLDSHHLRIRNQSQPHANHQKNSITNKHYPGTKSESFLDNPVQTANQPYKIDDSLPTTNSNDFRIQTGFLPKNSISQHQVDQYHDHSAAASQILNHPSSENHPNSSNYFITSNHSILEQSSFVSPSKSQELEFSGIQHASMDEQPELLTLPLDLTNLNEDILTDGFWHLKIFVTDYPGYFERRNQQPIELISVVSQFTSVDELMRSIISRLTDPKPNLENENMKFTTDHNWDDYLFYSPSKKIWYHKTHWVLKKYEINVNSTDIIFTPKHKILQVQLPDLSRIPVYANFSVPVYLLVKDLCKILNLTENFNEISLKKLKNEKTTPVSLENRENLNTRFLVDTNSTLPKQPFTPGKYTTMKLRIPSGKGNLQEQPSTKSNHSIGSIDLDKMESTVVQINTIDFYRLKSSLHQPVGQNFQTLNCFSDCKSLTTDVINWLDSSKSLKEQNIEANNIVSLQFKYLSSEMNASGNVTDANASSSIDQYDTLSKSTKKSISNIQINQMYQQLRYMILTNKVTTNLHEAFLLAALQHQIELKSITEDLNNETLGNRDFTLKKADSVEEMLNELTLDEIEEDSSKASVSKLSSKDNSKMNLRVTLRQKFTELVGGYSNKRIIRTPENG